MKRLTFKCSFLTDVVLNESAATEGPQKTVDYIPGSNFLGIVASDYDSYNEAAYDIFHNGKVRFGDGHLILAGRRSFKAPLAWFIEKGCKPSDNRVVISGFKESGEAPTENENIVIWKQVRSGFYAIDNDMLITSGISRNFSLKSKHDRKTGKSEDGKMFGYQSLPAGLDWMFYIDIEDGLQNYEQKIANGIIGKRRLGRSRSAEYGLVEISQVEAEINVGQTKTKDSFMLYADSDLVFFDKNGSPSYKPSASDLILPEGCNIDWSRSQIRTHHFSPWNQKRFTREADRYCISKGSVIFVKGEAPEFSEFVAGAYTNEGFGRILVNPMFLKANENGMLALNIKIADSVTDQSEPPVLVNEQDKALLEILKTRQKDKVAEDRVLKEVISFVEERKTFFGKIRSSQWSNIRNIATSATNDETMMKSLFDEGKGYLKHGVAAEDWKERGRAKVLEEKIKSVIKINGINGHVRDFVILAASEFAKTNKIK